jgi:hypothetical protein
VKRSTEVGTAKRRAPKVRIGELCPAEARPGEGRPAEIRSTKEGSGKVSFLQVRTPKISLSNTCTRDFCTTDGPRRSP